MSVHVNSWAWKQEVDDPTTKLVLLKLADQCNDEWECWPSRRTIGAECCNISPSTVTRHTSALAELGLLVILKRQRDNNSQTSNLYRLGPPTHGRVSPLRTDGETPYAPARPPEPSSEPSSEPLLAPASADAVWDALIALFGEPSNRNTRSKRNKAVQLIKESLAGSEDPAAEVRRRAARWTTVFPGASFTDTALANQWDALTPSSAQTTDPVRALELREREERLAAEALALPRPEQTKKLRELLKSMDGVVK